MTVYEIYDLILNAAINGEHDNLTSRLKDFNDKVLNKDGQHEIAQYKLAYQYNGVSISTILPHTGECYRTIGSHPTAREGIKNALRFEVLAHFEDFGERWRERDSFNDLLDVYSLLILLKFVNNVTCLDKVNWTDYNPVTITECRTWYDGIYNDFMRGERYFRFSIKKPYGGKAYTSDREKKKSIKTLITEEVVELFKNTGKRPTYKQLSRHLSLMTGRTISADTVRRTAEMYNLKMFFDVKSKRVGVDKETEGKPSQSKKSKIEGAINDYITEYGKKPTIKQLVKYLNDHIQITPEGPDDTLYTAKRVYKLLDRHNLGDMVLKTPVVIRNTTETPQLKDDEIIRFILGEPSEIESEATTADNGSSDLF